MQHATSGALYEFSNRPTSMRSGAIAARIRTPKFDGGSSAYKTMGSVEVIGDKISSTALLRHYTDDDFASFSYFRPVDLSIERSNLFRHGAVFEAFFRVAARQERTIEA
jgi:hypothetical protein